MQRMLVIVVVLLVAWRVLAALGRRLNERAPGADSFSRYSPEARRRRSQYSDRQKAAEDLVECSVCGVFVPSRRALTSGDDRVFCGEICQHRATTETGAGRV